MYINKTTGLCILTKKEFIELLEMLAEEIEEQRKDILEGVSKQENE